MYLEVPTHKYDLSLHMPFIDVGMSEGGVG